MVRDTSCDPFGPSILTGHGTLRMSLVGRNRGNVEFPNQMKSLCQKYNSRTMYTYKILQFLKIFKILFLSSGDRRVW